MLPPRALKKKRPPQDSDNDDLNVPKFGSGNMAKMADTAEEPWKAYFDKQLQFEIPTPDKLHTDKFNVYVAGSAHHNVLLCLHGGGHTSLSWCLVARMLKHAFCVVSYDSRGHGMTKCHEPDKLDNVQLVEDGLQIIKNIRDWIDSERKAAKERREIEEETKELSVRDRILLESRADGVPIVLMGHSLGGAIAIQLAGSGRVPNLQGLIVLDVVEGAALEALPAMKHFVEQFPSSFKAVDEAVVWALRHVLKNRESAELSVPSQLYYDATTRLWKWRVELSTTAQFWEGWFRGISDQFLTSRVGSGGKVLVLVGHDRLDKELTIGHMQGKYQLQIIAKSGHIIEEDQPEDVANIVLHFASRYRLLPPHVESLEPLAAPPMFPPGPMFPMASSNFHVNK